MKAVAAQVRANITVAHRAAAKAVDIAVGLALKGAAHSRRRAARREREAGSAARAGNGVKSPSRARLIAAP